MSAAGATEGSHVPDPHLLTIDDAKLTAYLLDFAHPEGASKAKFFTGAGFSAENIDEFKDALREHAARNKIAKIKPSAYGEKLIVECFMVTPSGAQRCVRVVWNDRLDGEPPHLITAHPLPAREPST